MTIDLSRGVNTPQVRGAPLDAAAIIDETACDRFAGNPELAFAVSDAKFINQNTVRVEFDSLQKSCQKTTSLDVPLR